MDVKDEDDGYCSEQTADLTSDDSDMEERTQLDICQFSRNYIKTYRRTDDEQIDDPKGLRPQLYRTTYRYAVYETMERQGYRSIPFSNHRIPKQSNMHGLVEVPSDYQSYFNS